MLYKVLLPLFVVTPFMVRVVVPKVVVAESVVELVVALTLMLYE